MGFSLYEMQQTQEVWVLPISIRILPVFDRIEYKGVLRKKHADTLNQVRSEA